MADLINPVSGPGTSIYSPFIERIARAICESSGCVWDENPCEESRLEWRSNARSALREMRNPTEEMLADANGGQCTMEATAEHLRIWRAMIDQALEVHK